MNSKIWRLKYWDAEQYIYSTSDMCQNKVSWDDKICSDPLKRIIHPCKKGECPFYIHEFPKCNK